MSRYRNSPDKHKQHGIVNICRPHYDMISSLHNDFCSQRPGPEAGQYHVTQPLSPAICQRCKAEIVNETVPQSPAGQSETIYWSSTSPQTLHNRARPSRDELLETAPTYGGRIAQLKGEETRVVRVESLDDEIKKELQRRRQRPNEERIKLVEAVNFLDPRPEPQVCSQETWLPIPEHIKDKDIEQPKRKQQQENEKVEQSSKEEFFECYVPPRDDYARRMEQLPNSQFKGLTDSEILLLDGVARNNRKHYDIGKEGKQIKPNGAKEANISINIKVDTPTAKISKCP